MFITCYYTDYWSQYTYKLICLDFNKDIIMWTKPAATEMRFGFEVTMYVMNK